MGTALYRKYRSKSMAEIIGQPHVTDTLRQAIVSGTISHAYLLTGPRGVGKTSIARILAHEINNLAYEDERTHLDIIEIDAASNRRIDEIRELRERVHTAPTSAKYKVYIIDEVHMLTKEAFNALLKTLEEPPKHAVFILATTEVHKVPDTILSRTQKFTFKPVSLEAVVAHLRTIADAESIVIDDAALEIIAHHGAGSFRDSISLLDQVRSMGDSVTADTVRQALGMPPKQTISDILLAMQAHDLRNLTEILQRARIEGHQPGLIAKQLSASIRQAIVQNNATGPNDVRLLKELLEVPASNDPFTQLEYVLVEASATVSPVAPQQPAKPVEHVAVTAQPVEHVAVTAQPVEHVAVTAQPVIEKPKPKNETASKEIVEPTPVAPEPPQAADEPEPNIEVTVQPVILGESLDDKTWQSALQAIKKSHNTLYSLVRMATPSLQDDELTLTFKFAFHQKRLNDAKNKQIIADILAALFNKPLVINCVVGTDAPAATTKPTDDKKTVATISNIFGSAEVLES